MVSGSYTKQAVRLRLTRAGGASAVAVEKASADSF